MRHAGKYIPIARELKNAKIVFSTYREGIKYVKQEGLSSHRSSSNRLRALPEKVRQCLQKETGERLAHIQEEALKHNGLENAVRTVVEMARG